MSRRLVAVAALVVLGVAVISNVSWRKRRQQRAAIADRREEYVVESVERYVDMGVALRVVVADPAGEVRLGDRRLRVLREHRFGGMIDTKPGEIRFIGPSLRPVVWHCSEDQEQILLHADAARPAQLVYGSEGAGKTTVLAMWHVLTGVLPHVGEGREGGQTAPTERRLDSLLSEMRGLYPRSWYKFKTARKVLEFADGTAIRLVSTHKQSTAQGSPLQSFNWSWAGEDEGQDSTAEHDNVTARLREARGGASRAPRLMTATAKDETAWRNARDKLEASGLWARRTLLGTRSPFIDPDHWVAMERSMSEREYRRRVLAADVGPERMLYPSYEREKTLVRRAELGWIDVTKNELRPWGANFAALVGHDPGTLFDVSLVLKAFLFHPRQVRPNWVVIGEITTEQSTTELHVVKLLELARLDNMNLLDRMGKQIVDGDRMLVRADPYGNTDMRPDRTVYTVFRNAGITIHPAAYSEEGTKPGRIPREGGIDLVNTLLCNAAGERRLYIAIDELGQPVAPRLVKSLEASERDAGGRAETQRKDRFDLSHWAAALRYALWAVERPRSQLFAGGMST